MFDTRLTDFKEQLDKLNADRVKVAVSDIDGVLRGKYMHKDKFISSIDSGFGFCSVIFGWDIADSCYSKGIVSGLHNGYPDVNAKVDLSTMRLSPWEDNIPFFLADFESSNGKALAACPRQLLKNVLQQCKEQGFNAKFGLEFEWFNFLETPHSLSNKKHIDPTTMSTGAFGYSMLRPGLNREYVVALMRQITDFGIPLEGFHCETGPGVLEAAIVAGEALEAADRGALFKLAVKEIATSFGFMASFMAKWDPTLPGCGGHMHQSLWDADNNVNLFHNEKDPHKMSELFKHYLAGQALLLPEFMPFFAPNINSYKRLVEGCWAPTKMSWGIDNRTTALRVIPGSNKSTRLETRLGGSDINPYLAIAAALAAGLYGIKHKLKLAPGVVGSAYNDEAGIPLSRTLDQACDKLANSSAAVELFGKDFIEHFLMSRRWECEKFNSAVTNFELERYFEIV